MKKQVNVSLIFREIRKLSETRNSMDFYLSVDKAIASALILEEPHREKALKLIRSNCLRVLDYQRWNLTITLSGRKPSQDELKSFFDRAFQSEKFDEAEKAAFDMDEPKRTDYLDRVLVRKMTPDMSGVDYSSFLNSLAKNLAEPTRKERLSGLVDWHINRGNARLAFEARELSGQEFTPKQLEAIFSLQLYRGLYNLGIKNVSQDNVDMMVYIVSRMEGKSRKEAANKIFEIATNKEDWDTILQFAKFFTEQQQGEACDLIRKDFGIFADWEAMLSSIGKAVEPFRSNLLQGLLEDSIQKGDHQKTQSISRELAVTLSDEDVFRLLDNMMVRQDYNSLAKADKIISSMPEGENRLKYRRRLFEAWCASGQKGSLGQAFTIAKTTGSENGREEMLTALFEKSRQSNDVLIEAFCAKLLGNEELKAIAYSEALEKGDAQEIIAVIGNKLNDQEFKKIKARFAKGSLEARHLYLLRDYMDKAQLAKVGNVIADHLIKLGKVGPAFDFFELYGRISEEESLALAFTERFITRLVNQGRLQEAESVAYSRICRRSLKESELRILREKCVSEGRFQDVKKIIGRLKENLTLSELKTILLKNIGKNERGMDEIPSLIIAAELAEIQKK